MAKAKTSPAHTAGPWQYHPTTKGQFAILGAYNAEKDAHRIICVTRNKNDQDRRNARLIVAAPDLLDACEGMCGLLYRDKHGHEQIDIDDYERREQKCRDAIAKARARSK